MAVQAAVLLARMAGGPCVRAEQSAVERPLHGVLNDTRQYREQLHASEAKPEAQLGATAKAMSLGGSVVARIIGRDMPPLIHTMRHFLP